MAGRHFKSFKELLDFLANEPLQTYTHRWRDAYAWMTVSGDVVSKAPKYLFRGEPGVFPTSLTSGGRVDADRMFDVEESAMLKELTTMAQGVWMLRTGDRFRSLGWPQHYGFPTPFLDVTSDPSVAVHFAGATSNQEAAPVRTFYRLDLEAIDHKVYAPLLNPKFTSMPPASFGETPLSVAYIGQMNCVRATRQSACVLCSNEEGLAFDFQRSPHLVGATERFTIDAGDAREYFDPTLLSTEDDAYAAWPLAVVRALHVSTGKLFSRRLAEWICGRIPLFEWTPIEVTYDQVGRGAYLGLMSPAEASARFNRSYVANRDAVIEELTSRRNTIPNGILFGMLTGGKPGASRWLHAGDECEIQWRYPFPQRGRSFERVVLR